MHIGATAAISPLCALPARKYEPFRCPSPLNLSRVCVARSAYSEKPSTATSNEAHVADLYRLLNREPAAESFLHHFLPNGSSCNFSDGVEAMSPRSLNLIQRLVSGPSPPSKPKLIGHRWRELHGADDWCGLLDPLDEDLRREIVRYGVFIQAAYHAFLANPEKLLSEPRDVVLPDGSYRVTANLYATSSIDAPWIGQPSSWIGFVAVCDSEREINRLGRRDIVIALRGTATAIEWAENFRAALVEIPGEENHKNPKVGGGFWNLYHTGSDRVPSLREAVLMEVKKLMNLYNGEQLSITVAGHSLGAALAVLVADELRGLPISMPPVTVFSFGGPHVGNIGFEGRVRARGVKILRVVNERDIITKVPGVFFGRGGLDGDDSATDSRARASLQISAADGKHRALLENWWAAVEKAMSSWSYSHAGTELKVDSRESPYMRRDADPWRCHALEAYLHLVDGFLSSRCPFRSDAARSFRT